MAFFEDVDFEGDLRGGGTLTVGRGWARVRVLKLWRLFAMVAATACVGIAFAWVFHARLFVSVFIRAAEGNMWVWILYPATILAVILAEAAIETFWLSRMRISDDHYEAFPPIIGLTDVHRQYLREHGLLKPDGTVDKKEVVEFFNWRRSSTQDGESAGPRLLLPAKVKFQARGAREGPPRPDLTASFRDYHDAKHCYELFTGESLPESTGDDATA